MGKTIKDRSLHAIAKILSEEDSIREHICGNLYMGERPTLLLEATHAMQGAQSLLDKEKNGETLSTKERKTLDEARVLQREIIAVDSFTHESYFKKKKITTTAKKV